MNLLKRKILLNYKYIVFNIIISIEIVNEYLDCGSG